MNTLRKAVTTVALLAGAAVPAAAQQPVGGTGFGPTEDQTPTRQGTRGANFLEIGVGARGQAMAGAVVSSTDTPSALYWNPAGLAATETFSVEATRQDLYTDLDIAHNFFGAAIPAFGGTIGAHVITLNSGDIERTTPDSPEGGDATVGESFQWNSMAIGVSYARRLTDRLSLGGTVKVITEGITDAKTTWGAVDVGTQFNTGLYGVVLGASVLNVGPASEARGSALRRNVDTDFFSPQRTEIGYATQSVELPTMFRFSVGLDLLGQTSSLFQMGPKNRLIGELAFSDAIDTDLQFAAGAEYSFNNFAFLRVGKRFYNDERDTGSDGSDAMYGFSGGAGIRIPIASRSLRLDYGYTSLGDLENIQVITIGFGR